MRTSRVVGTRQEAVADAATERLTVDGICAGYGAADVLDDVSFGVSAGEVVALLGANGAGKSTLLRTISGLIRPRSGRIVLLGEDVTTLSPHSRSTRGLCEIPEGRGIFPSLTVRENLVLLSPRRHDETAIPRALDMFPSLKAHLGQVAGSLSGGEQQMLAVSRAVMAQPAVVMFDEVSLGLAPVIVDRIYDAVSAIIAAGAAVLLVEQYVERALELATTAVVLDRGRVAYAGTTANLQSLDLFEMYLGHTSLGQSHE